MPDQRPSPTPAAPLRLGTRRSPLAMAQAEETRARLCAAHGWHEDAVALVPVTASGDRIQDRPLAEIGGKALWTRELDACLLDGRIDAAVHSLKDVETVRPPELSIAAVLPRADRRDRLLGAMSLSALPRGACVGTSAPRRAAQLLHHRPDCRVVSIRGNVATRMAKLAAGEVDATFLAAAGLERLGETGVGTALDPAEWLPAPAQGAIGIECLTDNAQVRTWLAAVTDPASEAEVRLERALLAGLGGSCHSAIAALTRWEGRALILAASLFTPDGAVRVDGEARLAPGDEAGAIALAVRLLEDGGPTIAAHFSGPG